MLPIFARLAAFFGMCKSCKNSGENGQVVTTVSIKSSCFNKKVIIMDHSVNEEILSQIERILNTNKSG